MEAWKQLKLIREYEQRKKLEMMGAMVFNSAGGETGQRGNHVHFCFLYNNYIYNIYYC